MAAWSGHQDAWGSGPSLAIPPASLHVGYGSCGGCSGYGGFDGLHGSGPFCSSPGTALGANRHDSVASEVRRIFLELGPEEMRQKRASDLLQRASDRDAAECISTVLDRLVNFASARTLGVYILAEVIRFHPVAMVNEFTPQRVYDLFNPGADDRPAGAFLHHFLSYKHSQGLGTKQETEKVQKLLLRRSKQHDLRRVPTSPLRIWLGKIWKDVPSSVPDRQLLSGCCARWVADRSTTAEEKIPLLCIMRQEFELRGRPDGDAWILSMVLEQVCRDPVNHSPDLQQMLWLLGSPPAPAVLKPLLMGLSQERGRLATLWVCLSLFPPQPQAPDVSQPWPQGSPPPIHSLMRSVLVAFTQLAGADDLCRTSILSLGAIAAAGAGAIAMSAASLLLLLHIDGPMLASNVWMPLVPVLERIQSQPAFDLLTRLRHRSTGVGPNPAQFASAPACQFPPGYDHGCTHQAQIGHAQPGCNMPQHASPGVDAGQFQSAPAGQQQPVATVRKNQTPCPPDQVEMQYETPRVGLQNTNNTCYMNTFIQGLYMTNHFVWRIMDFKVHLKKNASKMDKEDYQFGKKVVDLLKRQMTRMAVTKYKHTDITEILNGFPADYRSGQQQDVTETIRFVFDKLGGFEQPLIREVFAGELSEKLQCQVCGTIKSRPETFSDLVLSVPKAEEAIKQGFIPTTQALLDQRLQFELMDLTEPVFCDTCQAKQRAGKWCEIVSPPAHICVCLNRFSFDIQAMDFTKEKTPVVVDGTVQIGPFTYVLYFVIVHTGKDATSGHYYAIGHRSEEGPGQGDWTLLDDSQLKEADMTLLKGNVKEKLKDDTPYVLFYRCLQAPMTPSVRIAKKLHAEIKKEQDSRVES